MIAFGQSMELPTITPIQTFFNSIPKLIECDEEVSEQVERMKQCAAIAEYRLCNDPVHRDSKCKLITKVCDENTKQFFEIISDMYSQRECKGNTTLHHIIQNPHKVYLWENSPSTIIHGKVWKLGYIEEQAKNPGSKLEKHFAYVRENLVYEAHESIEISC